MCGRYAASSRAEDIAELFGIRPEHVVDRPEPSYNVAPTDPVPAVLPAPDDGRELRLLRWGLLYRPVTQSGSDPKSRFASTVGAPSAFSRHRLHLAWCA